MTKAKVGIIGGTGLYELEGLTGTSEIEFETPFGQPSDNITVGNIAGIDAAFLPRHGKRHQFSPSEVPYLANIYALKSLGVEFIIAVNSVGSLRMELAPEHLLIPDQLIDRTTQRKNSFFTNGVVAHIEFADPFCPMLRGSLYTAATECGATVHPNGTYIVTEGPSFSTRAESKLHRSWGADIIGMTALPEARLAREAEICYAIIACITDYDSWLDTEAPVSVSAVSLIMQRTTLLVKKTICHALDLLPTERTCLCPNALAKAITTPKDSVPAEVKGRLGPIASRYLR